MANIKFPSKDRREISIPLKGQVEIFRDGDDHQVYARVVDKGEKDGTEASVERIPLGIKDIRVSRREKASDLTCVEIYNERGRPYVVDHGMTNQVTVRLNRSREEIVLSEEEPLPVAENLSLSVGSLRLDIDVIETDKIETHVKECRKWLEEGKIRGTLRSLKNIKQSVNKTGVEVEKYFSNETTRIEPLISKLETNSRSGREEVPDDIKREGEAFLDEIDMFLINQ